MNTVDLFSGIGGFALAASWAGLSPSVFCEIDPYCQKVLKKHWPDVPCVSDIHDLKGSDYAGCYLLTGGFPCQPFSVAGKQRGKDDDRHLWPQMRRVASEARPHWVLAENVPGIIAMELDNCLADLESIGYACQPITVPACAVDAKHRRDRLWIVANATQRQDHGRKRGVLAGAERSGRGKYAAVVAGGENVSDAEPAGLERQWPDPGQSQVSEFGNNCPSTIPNAGKLQRNRRGDRSCWWEREPRETICDVRRRRRKEDGLPVPKSLLGRVAHGIPNRVDRLKGLGNAIVPQVAYEIMRMMIAADGVEVAA